MALKKPRLSALLNHVGVDDIKESTLHIELAEAVNLRGLFITLQSKEVYYFNLPVFKP